MILFQLIYWLIHFISFIIGPLNMFMSWQSLVFTRLFATTFLVASDIISCHILKFLAFWLVTERWTVECVWYIFILLVGQRFSVCFGFYFWWCCDEIYRVRIKKHSFKMSIQNVLGSFHPVEYFMTNFLESGILGQSYGLNWCNFRLFVICNIKYVLLSHPEVI